MKCKYTQKHIAVHHFNYFWTNAFAKFKTHVYYFTKLKWKTNFVLIINRDYELYKNNMILYVIEKKTKSYLLVCIFLS